MPRIQLPSSRRSKTYRRRLLMNVLALMTTAAPAVIVPCGAAENGMPMFYSPVQICPPVQVDPCIVNPDPSQWYDAPVPVPGPPPTGLVPAPLMPLKAPGSKESDVASPKVPPSNFSETTPSPLTGNAPSDAGVTDDVDPETPDASPDPSPNPATNLNNLSASDFASSSGASTSGFSAAPTIIGDFQGGGLSQFSGIITQDYSFYANGTRGLVPVFDRIGGGIASPDITAVSGTGQSVGGSPFINQFEVSEPLPLSDASGAPGPGFQYQGGTATYTAVDGSPTPSNLDYTDALNPDIWFIEYGYAAALGATGANGARPIPGPGVSVRRVKIAENFSPEIRNRFFTSFSFFNDAFGGLGDISRFIIGTERVLVDELVSLELRLPIAATYSSQQDLGVSEDRDAEFGNITFISKFALWRSRNTLISGGVGVGAPTADDSELRLNGVDLLRIENESVQILPFLALLTRLDRNWTFQSYLQLDVASGGDPILVNSDLQNPTAGTLLQAGKFNDSTLMHLDVAATRQIYQNRCRAAKLNSVLANAELHYTGTLQDSDFVMSNNLTYKNLKENFDVVNATFGSHLVFNNGLVITPAMSVPLSDGLDKQFDYEAIVQVNYFR